MKKTLIYISFFCVVFLPLSIVFVASCTHESDIISELDTVCFEKQILPIMQTSCGMSGCHNSGSGESGFDATNYNSILSIVTPFDARKSKLYEVITKLYGEDMMPPDRPLSQEQRSLIMVWIEQGALETVCNSDTSENPGNIDPDSVCFVQDVQPLLYSSCGTSGCHDTATAEEGYIITDYEHIMADDELVVPFNPGESKMYKAIMETGNDRMPPSPLSAFTAEQKEVVRKWIADGALNSDCPTSVCDTLNPISFSNQVWPAINQSCVGCHNASNSSGGVNLNDYNQIYIYSTTLRNSIPILSGVINQTNGFKAMPPAGKFDECTIRMIDLWIEQGSQNN